MLLALLCCRWILFTLQVCVYYSSTTTFPSIINLTKHSLQSHVVLVPSVDEMMPPPSLIVPCLERDFAL